MPKTIEAPYVETDIRMLGDTHLSPEESVIREREKCLKDASKFRIEDQDELADPNRSVGPRFNHTHLLAKLSKIAPGLTARDGSPGNLALYFPRNARQLTEYLQEGGTSNEFFIFNHYVGGFPKAELPEWGHVDIDTSLIATREHLRGWRTVLIGLLKAGVISYQDAISEFGDPATDKRNGMWMKQTLTWRQNPNQKFTAQDYMEGIKA